MKVFLRMLRAGLAAFALAAAGVAPAQAGPVLVMQGSPGVDVNNLVVGQVFGVDVVITGINGETFQGGGGGLYNGDPLVQLIGAVIGTIGTPLNGTDTLFHLTLQALGVGSGSISTSGSSITTNVATYRDLSSGPLNFTVVSSVAEPGSLALGLLALAGLAAARRRVRA